MYRYLVSAKSEQIILQLVNLWRDSGCTYNDVVFNETECVYSFEGFCTTVFDVMERVIRVIQQIKSSGGKEEFTIAGKCSTDYDCSPFLIDCSGNEPMIKAVQGDPDDDEGCYYAFCEADYFEIPNLLEDESFRTFKQAVDEDLPLGGFWMPLTKNGTPPLCPANESESFHIAKRRAACVCWRVIRMFFKNESKPSVAKGNRHRELQKCFSRCLFLYA